MNAAVVVAEGVIPVTAAAAMAASAALRPLPDGLGVRALFVEWASTTGHAGSHLHDLFARASDDTTELWRIVLQSLRLEEAVASGCLLLQALALVRLWKVENHVPRITIGHERTLCDWRQC
jgi:hypothetical protein